ncbi:hypothetical protein [Erythrobacter sp. QSSC1-22B]|uniref:hypothetical protein n=1 Tax=Erythrobacter sp. QSSC1-22B TaxID=1860125 RepID=UPI00119D30BB|nr:hypothetical protein [Erythrobacter sp. QSSC1-22B]
MAKAVESFMDAKGHLHQPPSNSERSGIATMLGRVVEEGGLTDGVARLILEKLCEIEQTSADIDKLEVHHATKLKVIERRSEPA